MPRRETTYRPGLAWLAALGSAWVFVLVTLGAFTTTLGAGMAFPDWPLSNGSLSPRGWLDDLFMFAEHSHRLSGTTMGVVTLVLALWVWRVEERRWVRRVAAAALVVVALQGVIGGTRVLFDGVFVPGLSMSVGRLLRIPHGVVAQVFVCLLFALAAALSRPWLVRDTRGTGGAGVRGLPRRLGVVCLTLLLVQLVVAATMRHDFAGMAIPTFPFSTPDGGLLPRAWDHRVALQFAHRAVALVLAVAVSAYGVALARHAGLAPPLRVAGGALVALIAGQVALGGAVILSGRDAYVTTAHVVVGAVTLASTFVVTMFVHRAAAASEAVGEHDRGDEGPGRADPEHEGRLEHAAE